MSEAEDLQAYIRENYGTCTNEKGCSCHTKIWLGTLCPFWIPVAAKDWATFMTGAKTAHALRKRSEGKD